MCAALHVRMRNDNTIGWSLYMHSSMCGRSGRSVDSPGPPDRRAQVGYAKWYAAYSSVRHRADYQKNHAGKGLCELAIRVEPTSADSHRTHAPIESLSLFLKASNANRHRNPKIYVLKSTSFVHERRLAAGARNFRVPVVAQFRAQGRASALWQSLRWDSNQ